MRFSTTAGALRSALAAARTATPPVATLVAYSAVVVAARPGRVRLTGGDGITIIAATLGTDVTVVEEPGEVLVFPAPVATYLDGLTTSAKVTVSDAAGELVLTGPSGHPYRFRALATTFPRPSDVPSLQPAPLAAFQAAIAGIRHAASGSPPAVQLTSSGTGPGSRVTLAATDGYRLAVADLPGAGFGDVERVLPLSVCELVGRRQLSEAGAGPVMVRFAGEGVDLATRGLRVNFPAISSVTDARPAALATLPTEEVLAALGRLRAVVSSGQHLGLRVRSDTLELHAGDPEVGTGVEVVDLDGDGGELDCAVNLAFLRQAVEAHKAPTVELFADDPMRPLYLCSTRPVTLTTVVMPVRP